MECKVEPECRKSFMPGMDCFCFVSFCFTLKKNKNLFSNSPQFEWAHLTLLQSFNDFHFTQKKIQLKMAYRAQHTFSVHPSDFLPGHPLKCFNPATQLHTCSSDTRSLPDSGCFLWHITGLEFSVPKLAPPAHTHPADLGGSPSQCWWPLYLMLNDTFNPTAASHFPAYFLS